MISKELLDIAKRNTEKENLTKRIKILNCDIRNLPFKSNSFDYVLCEGDVLCITPNPNRVL